MDRIDTRDADAPAAPASRWWLRQGVILAALAAAAISIGWTGFIASDDVSYYLGAERWVDQPPFAGVDHWTTRFPVVLSLAASILLLGGGEIALAATAIFWFVAFVAVATALALRIGGPRVGVIAAPLFATIPLTATAASVVGCDLAEQTFLVLGMFWLMREAGGGPARLAATLGAGISFGIAILCRETALLALIGFVPIFLLGRPLSRVSLIVAAMGAFLVLGGEMAFQWWATGDPLHRYALAAGHDSTIDRAANLEGNLLVHPVIDPLLVLLVNNEFGLLFWIAGAALVAGAHRRITAAQRRQLAIPLALSLATFAIVAVLSELLVLNPRYFGIAIVPAIILVALWLDQVARPVRWVMLAALIASNLLLLSVQNPRPRWGMNALVLAATEHPDRTVVASPQLVRYARLPIAWQGITNIADRAAAPGALHLIEQAAAPPGARIVARYPAPPRPLGMAIDRIGLTPRLPQRLADVFMRPGPDMILVDPAGASASIPTSPASAIRQAPVPAGDDAQPPLAPIADVH